MKASELQDFLVAALVRNAGGSRRRWRMALGPIVGHSRATHSHCNWSVAPSGTSRENSVIERMLDDLRLEHPFVKEG